MSIASTGSPSFNPPITTALSSTFLLTPTPESIALTQAMRTAIESHEGNTLRMVQIPLLPIFPNAIPNNSSGPSPIAPSFYNRDVQLAIYAQCTILDVSSVLTSQIEWIRKILQAQEVSMTRTEDYLASSTLSATGNTIYATGGTNGDAPTNMSNNDAYNVTGALYNANAPRTTDNIPGENKFGTNPLAAGYLMLTSSVASSVFLQDSNFTQARTYPDQSIILPSEIGQYGNLRVLISTDWPIYNTALSINGYPILQGAITSVMSYVFVVHSAMYRQIQSVGAAFYGANMLQVGTSAQNYVGCSIVQPEWVYNILYTAA